MKPSEYPPQHHATGSLMKVDPPKSSLLGLEDHLPVWSLPPHSKPPASPKVISKLKKDDIVVITETLDVGTTLQYSKIISPISSIIGWVNSKFLHKIS